MKVWQKWGSLTEEKSGSLNILKRRMEFKRIKERYRLK